MAAVDNKEFFSSDLKTPKLLERIESLYDSSKWHDCEFKLSKSEDGTEEIIYAHSLILASCSPVFEALCYGPLAEKKPVCIPDIDPVAFRMMIKFMYTDCVEFSSVETACNVLYASKKYLIYSLANLAISYISLQINEINCLQIHEFATFINEDRLIKESWHYFCSHLDDVAKHFTCDSLSKEFICAMLSEESLNGGELMIFEMCLVWAESECMQRNIEICGENLRKILIEIGALNKLRLLTLSLKEFEDGPKKAGILNEEETCFIEKTISLMQKMKREPNDDTVSSISRGPSDAKISKSSISIQNAWLEVLQKKIYEENSCSVISTILESRRKIPLQKLYCHRYIDKVTRHNGCQNNFKIITVVSSNKLVRLIGIFLNAKVLPIPHSNTIYTHTCVIERDYLERLHVRITNDQSEVLFSTYFTETVKYGTVFKIVLSSPIVLERNKKYKIKIDFVNSVENYQFGVGNSISKFFSGLSISFKEWASIGREERFIQTDDLSVISGLELWV